MAPFARSAWPERDRFPDVGAFAVGLFVRVTVNIDAASAAVGAMSPTCGTVLAKTEPRVRVGTTSRAKATVAEGLAAREVSTHVPHVRLPLVVQSLIFEESVLWAPPRSLT